MNKPLPSLKLMAESKDDFGVGKRTAFKLDPRVIQVRPGFNGRPIDSDHVRSMADSYKAGATFPDLFVDVEGGAVFLVDGHHRLEAALLAISEGAPIVSLNAQQFTGNEADRVMLMVTSQQGLPMTTLQLGRQYKKLEGWGWEVKAIAARAGKSVQHVKDAIALAETAPDVQKLVDGKQVSAGLALKTVRQEGTNAGASMLADLEKATAAGKTKLTPKNSSSKPVRMTLPDAIAAEMASGGITKAHDMCPKYADLINFLRGTAK